jgi:tripartite-type tricarboxylate transporter receptor subunit TctC
MKCLFACVFATSLAFGPSPDLHAQTTYPNKTIRLVVPYSAGGTGDQIGRLVGDKLGELLGQRVLIDNKGGAGGNIGAEATVRSPADGYTLVMAATSLASNPALVKKMSFDPVKDLVPVRPRSPARLRCADRLHRDQAHLPERRRRAGLNDPERIPRFPKGLP